MRCSVHASVPDAYAQCAHQLLMQMGTHVPKFTNICNKFVNDLKNKKIYLKKILLALTNGLKNYPQQNLYMAKPQK